MTRLATFLLVIGILVLGLIGCDSFFQFNPPNGSDDDAGNEESAGQILFFDDFEDGADPQWRYSSNSNGFWIVKDGQYTIDDEAPTGIPFQTYVGSQSWSDYIVEMDVLNLRNEGQEMAILLRAQDEDNMVAFAMCTANPCGRVVRGAALKVKSGGQWEIIEEMSNPKTRNFHISATVDDNEYYISVNGSRILQAELSNHPQAGFVGIQSANDAASIAFDNFRVRRLED